MCARLVKRLFKPRSDDSVALKVTILLFLVLCLFLISSVPSTWPLPVRVWTFSLLLGLSMPCLETFCFPGITRLVS